MGKYWPSLCILICIISSCETADPTEDLLNEVHIYAGSHLYEDRVIEFDFRKYHLILDQNHGDFTYSRSYSDSSGHHLQVLTKDTLLYTIDGKETFLTSKKINSIVEGVNSQAYFNMLPYKLKDAAVHKNYLGIQKIKGKEYHKLRVTFSEENGGADFEDKFLYWFDTDDYSMDYLAYLFHVNGGGQRFRVAKNQRRVGDIIFQDWDNYKPVEDRTELEGIGDLYNDDLLSQLSEIIHENVVVHDR